MSRHASMVLGLALGISGCAPPGAGGLAWPKQHVAEVDGGESLAPRPKTQIAASVASSDDHTPAASEAPVVPAAAATPAAATAATTTTASGEEITTEDLVIEVDE